MRSHVEPIQSIAGVVLSKEEAKLWQQLGNKDFHEYRDFEEVEIIQIVDDGHQLDRNP